MDAEDDRDAGRVRKRRFSSARIQPTRVKKVMQSDDEIGRMIASVPVAMCAAMEHFAEKLLESAAQCVQSSSARTLTPSHIRYAIMNNQHFSFLQQLTQEIQTPRIDESIGEHSGTQTPKSSTANTGLPTQLLPQLVHSGNFSPNIYQQQQHNFPQFPQMVSPFPSNYDLNANTSHQRPVQLIKEQDTTLIQSMSTSNIKPSEIVRKLPSVESKPSTTQAKSTVTEISTQQVKRTRGRPRKEKKEKFVEATTNEVPTFSASEDNPNGFALGTQIATTPEELDRILMPPPTVSGLVRRSTSRESVNNENSECTATSTPNRSSSKKTSLTAV